MLREDLDDLTIALAAAGSPVREHLRPGLKSAGVLDRLRSLRLEPVGEVVELFSWADGIDDPEQVHVFWECNLYPLDDLVSTYRQNRRHADEAADAGDAWPGPPGWFPVLMLDQEEFVAVDCGDGPGRGSLWFLSAEDEPQLIFTDLGEAVAAAAYCARAGLWRPSTSGQIEADRGHMPWVHDRAHPPWCELHH